VKKIILFGFLILVLAFGLRLYNLTLWPVFGDEAIYIRWAQVMGAEPTLRFLPLSDGKQPLFMWVLMFLVRRFSDPLFIGRLVSVATGMGTVGGIFAVSYLLFKNTRAALTASLVWAISPFAVFFDRMALVDSMLAMFGIWTLFFGVLTVKTQRLDMAMITGFMLGFALLTKSPALFFVILLPTTLVFGEHKKLFKHAILLLVTLTIGFAMYNIQRLGPNFHLLSSRTGDYVFPFSHLWENPKDPFIFHFHRAGQWLWIMGPSMVIGLLVFGVWLNRRKYWRELLLLAIWSVLPIAVQAEFAKVFTARYIFFSIPVIFVLAGAAFIKSPLPKFKHSGSVSWVLLIVFVVQALLFDQKLLTNPEAAPLPPGERAGYLEEWTAGTGIREVADLMKHEHAKDPAKQIVVGTEGYFGTLPDGLQMYLEGVPNVVVIGVGLDISEIPEPLAESIKAGNKTYLVANSSRLKFKGDFADHGLEIIASYPKALRRTDARDFVIHGPRDTFYLLRVTGKAKADNI